MRLRRELIRDLASGGVANAQLIFVDVSIVDPVNGESAQDVVVHIDLAFVMFETERFEEILVDDDRAGRDDSIVHVVSDKIDNHVLETGGEKRAGQAKNDGAILV